MSATGAAAIEDDGRQAIYEHLERAGPERPERVRQRLGLDERGFRHHVAILRRDGYVEESDGRLRVAIEEDERERYSEDGVDFAVRPARDADLSGLVGVIRQVAAERTYIEAESVADVIDHEETILRHDEVESRMFFVATVEEDVVGWVHLHTPTVEKLSHTARLTLGVLEEYRGQGVGERLLDRGLAWAAEHDRERIYQSAPATNERAIEFLEAQGWEVEAVREDHYRIGEEYVDEVMMGVRL